MEGLKAGQKEKQTSLNATTTFEIPKKTPLECTNNLRPITAFWSGLFQPAYKTAGSPRETAPASL